MLLQLFDKFLLIGSADSVFTVRNQDDYLVCIRRALIEGLLDEFDRIK